MNNSSSRVPVSSNGAFPRSGDSAEETILRKTSEAFHRGERTIADLLDAENVLTKFLISEQVRAGVDCLTDGCGRWADPISHIAAKYEGISLGAKRTLPGTKQLYRVPRIVGKLGRKSESSHSLAEEYRYARNALGLLPTSPERAGRLSLKPVLTGPYTLARYSESELPGFGSVEARAEAFAELLSHEIAPLAQAGAGVIHIDEHAILAHPDDWEVFKRVIGHISMVRDAASKNAPRRINLALHVYGGPQAALLDMLLKLPADVIGLDFTSDKSLLSAVAGSSAAAKISAGLVSGRDQWIEDAADVKKVWDALVAGGMAPVSIGPAGGLEGLSPDTAFAKLSLLSALER